MTRPAVVKSASLALLFQSRTFLAFFFTQFLGALNDNLFKTALSLLIAFQALDQSQSESSILVNLAAILFILPFFLLSPRAGEVADRYGKARLVRRIKAFEIVLMVLGAVGFYLGNTWMLLGILFMMGVQSTFFGPLKYSYLPEVLRREQLVGANALVQGSTFIGIILGMMLAGVLFSLSGAHLSWVWLAALAVAVLGYLSSRWMTEVPPGVAPVTVHRRGIRALIRLARENFVVWRAILGISWFWLVGATYITQLPNFVRYQLYADEQVFLLTLTLFALGIGAGALLCNALKNRRSSGYSVVIGLLGLTLSGLVLPQFTLEQREVLLELGEFMEQVQFPLLLSLLLLGVSGGLYIVPLYTVLQVRSDQQHRSRMVAANNIMNAAFMVLSAVVALALLGSGLSINALFEGLALANLAIVLLFLRVDRDFLTAVNRLYRLDS